mgnify:CR=1 FL=1
MTTMLGVFRVGDRIKVRITTPFVQAGTLGTILRVYRSLANAYDIQFDRDSHHWNLSADLSNSSALVLYEFLVLGFHHLL